VTQYESPSIDGDDKELDALFYRSSSWLSSFHVCHIAQGTCIPAQIPPTVFSLLRWRGGSIPECAISNDFAASPPPV